MKKKVIIETEFDAVHQLEIEQIVLGSVLINKFVIDEIASEFDTRLFIEPRHKTIANAIIEIHMEGKHIDLLTLMDNLKGKKKLAESGGVVYLSNLTSRIGSTENVKEYISLLKNFYLNRYTIQVCAEANRNAIEYMVDPVDNIERTIESLNSALKDAFKQSIDVVGDIHENIIAKAYELKNEGGMSGVPSGLDRLDMLTNGWQKSDLVIVAGRPGMGKTAFAVSVLIEPVVNQNIPVAIFSLEMSKEQLVARIQSIMSGVNVSKVVKKQLTEPEIDLIDRSCLPLGKAPLYIDDTANISVMEFKTKCRKLVKDQGVQLIVVDYLQLMRSGLKTNSREQEVAEISKSLKAVAKELNVPVIALSQLSRSVEQRGGDKKPILSDLRDSGQVEQDADMVIFTHRPEYFGQENYNWLGTDLDSKELFMVVIAKHRNGVIGEIPLSFKGEQTKVANHPDSQNLYRSADFNSKPLQQIAEFSSKPLQQIADFNSKNIQRNTTFDADFNSKNIQQIKSLDFGNLSNAHPDAPNDLDIYENTPF